MNRIFKLTIAMLFALALALPTFAQTSSAPAEGKAAESSTMKKEAAPKKTKKTHKKRARKQAKEAAAAPKQ